MIRRSLFVTTALPFTASAKQAVVSMNNNNTTTLSSSSSFLSSSLRFFTKLTNTSEYHNISEHFIEDASIWSDKLLDEFTVIEDSNVSDGVLEIKTNEGTFVLNKQAPLLQLWYSSPISGPHHYDYDTETKRWKSDKDKHDLQDKMERELTKVVGKDVKF